MRVQKYWAVKKGSLYLMMDNSGTYQNPKYWYGGKLGRGYRATFNINDVGAARVAKAISLHGGERVEVSVNVESISGVTL